MPPRDKPVVGTKFGRLTVLAVDGYRDGYLWVNFQCDCGKTKLIRYSTVKTGQQTSCGCLRIEKMREAKSIDLSESSFGFLTYVEDLGYVKKANSGENHNHRMIRCRCACGKIVDNKANHLLMGLVTSCGSCSKRMAGVASATMRWKR
jgi:hypothetical protein